MRLKSRATVASVVVALAAACAPVASADVAPTTVVDAGGGALVALEGAAMASDGTGAVVYRRIDQGRPHVYAARYDGRAWGPGQRVDPLPYAAGWARVAAGDGGRLVAVWSQEFGPGSDRLYSSHIDPGAHAWSPPVLVDAAIGEATGTQPALAMSSSGRALVAYRVTLAAGGQTFGVPPDLDRDELRLARFNGQTWSRIGVLNRRRDEQAYFPQPQPGNGPQVAVARDGTGLVAWQELDDQRVPRIWARRVFASALGQQQLVNPADSGGTAPADQLALAATGFAGGVVAFRMPSGVDGIPARPRIYAATIGDNQQDAAKWNAPALVAEGPGAAWPAPAIDDDGHVRLAYALGAATMLASGTVLTPPQGGDRLDDGASVVTPTPQTTLGAGGEVTAWQRQGEARSGVAVRETRDGQAATAQLTTPSGGPVAELRLAGSGLGDALIGWRQGPPGGEQIGVTVVDAGPGAPEVTLPDRWLRPGRVRVAWTPGADALGGVRWDVLVDGVARVRGTEAQAVRLPVQGLEDGRYEVRVRAVDRDGAATLSAPRSLRVDGTPPRIRVSVAGRRVLVRAADGGTARASGVKAQATLVDFGDGRPRGTGGSSVRRTLRAGPHRLSVQTRDRAGNRARLVREVRVG